MSLAQIVRDIKSVKIQGAESIAKSGIEAIAEIVTKSRTNNPKILLAQVNIAIKQLSSARPVEPFLFNSLRYISKINSNSSKEATKIKKEILAKCQEINQHIENSKVNIRRFGANKIKNGMVIYTHCHSSTVMDILKEAKKQGKQFEVNNTETRPLFQGRKTAVELASIGIPVRHYIDSAARLALKNADIMLIGCDMLTSEGKVVNKIGSELIAQAAKKRAVPVYACTNSWKFSVDSIYGLGTSKEMRNPKEVWDKPPKNVIIENPAFEQVDPELLTGVITELGIYKPYILLEEIKNNYPWMFRY